MPNIGNIKQCTIVLTRDCNLRCKFCYAKSAGYSVNERVSIDNLKKIVDFCNAANVKFIVFTGGDPLLHPDLIGILTYIKEKTPSIQVAVPTNGVLLENKDFCKQLLECGVVYFDISLKGNNSEEWIKTTGYDGYKKQQVAINNLSHMPIDFTCSMVVTNKNVNDLCNMVAQAKKCGAKQFSFTFEIDNEQRFEDGAQYLNEHNPFFLVQAFLRQMEQLNSITDDWWIEYSYPLCVYTEEQLKMLEGRLASPCQIHMKDAVTFTPQMELLPCDMYIRNPIGILGKDFNTYQEFLEFVDSKENYQKVMEPLRRQPSITCISCKHREACFGGCPVLWKNYSFDELMECKKRTYQLA